MNWCEMNYIAIIVCKTMVADFLYFFFFGASHNKYDIWSFNIYCKVYVEWKKNDDDYLQFVRCNVSYSACVVRYSSKRSSKNFSIFFTVSGATLSSSLRFSIFDRILLVSHSGLSIVESLFNVLFSVAWELVSWFKMYHFWFILCVSCLWRMKKKIERTTISLNFHSIFKTTWKFCI